jgi:hypothetical protein
VAAYVIHRDGPYGDVRAAEQAWHDGDADEVRAALIRGVARLVGDWGDHERPVFPESHRVIADAMLTLASRDARAQMAAFARVYHGQVRRRTDPHAAQPLCELIELARNQLSIADAVRHLLPVEIARFEDGLAGGAHHRMWVRLGSAVVGHLTFDEPPSSSGGAQPRLSTALWAVPGTEVVLPWTSSGAGLRHGGAYTLAAAFTPIEPLLGDDGSLASRLEAFRRRLEAGGNLPPELPCVGDDEIAQAIARHPTVPEGASRQQRALVLAGYAVRWSQQPDGRVLAVAHRADGSAVGLDDTGRRIPVPPIAPAGG